MNAPAASHPALEQLADIHLPPPVPAFPWAPGWWLLLALAITGLAALTVYLWRRHRGRAYRRAALTELESLAGERSDSAFAQQLNQLLRRVALHSYPRSAVAGLSGERWRAFLRAAPGAGEPFSEQELLQLEAAAYRADASIADRQQLLARSRQWIQRHRSDRHV